MRIFPLILTFLYLDFRLDLSVLNRLGRWDCPAACRRQDSGANEFATFWDRLLAEPAGSRNRWSLCPKLEPLNERLPLCGTSSDVPEGARTL